MSLIGLTTAAAGTGSIFARLRQIYEFVTTSGAIATKQYRSFGLTQQNAQANTWYTALNITNGKGFLYYVGAHLHANIRIRFTVDGVETTCQYEAMRSTFPGGATGPLNTFIRFDNSLKIEIMATAQTTLYCFGDYGLI